MFEADFTERKMRTSKSQGILLFNGKALYYFLFRVIFYFILLYSYTIVDKN